jgi:hypothetical protein
MRALSRGLPRLLLRPLLLACAGFCTLPAFSPASSSSRHLAAAYRIPLNMVLQSNTLLQVPFIMYAARDAPGASESSAAIILDVTATTLLPAAGAEAGAAAEEPRIEVLVVEERDLPKLGGRDDEDRELACCTELVRQKYALAECEVDRVFTASAPEGQFLTQSFALARNATNQRVRLAFATNATSIYYLVLSTCEHDAVRLDGFVTARNAYGWLPGQYYHELPFYTAMLCAYVVIGACWLYICLANRADIVQVHVWFTVVIGVALVDTLLKFLDVSWWNADDVRSSSLVVLHAVSSSLLMTLTLTLILVLSLGLAVVRPSLGRLRFFVGCFSATFFVFETARLVMDRFSVTLSNPPPQDISSDGSAADAGSGPAAKSSAQVAYEAAQSFAYILVLPSAVMQAFAYAWIFQGLANTVRDLSERRQDVKLKLFVAFQNVLLFAGVTVVVWLFAVTAIRATGTIEERWNLVWVLETSPDVLYILIFLAVVWLWRPKTNSKRYALYEQAGVALDEVDGLEFSDEDDEYLPDELEEDDDDEETGGPSGGGGSGSSSARRRGGEIELGGMAGSEAGSGGSDEGGNEDLIWGKDAYDSDDNDIVA